MSIPKDCIVTTARTAHDINHLIECYLPQLRGRHDDIDYALRFEDEADAEYPARIDVYMNGSSTPGHYFRQEDDTYIALPMQVVERLLRIRHFAWHIAGEDATAIIDEVDRILPYYYCR